MVMVQNATEMRIDSDLLELGVGVAVGVVEPVTFMGGVKN